MKKSNTIKPGTRYRADYTWVEKRLNIPHNWSVVAECETGTAAKWLAARLNKLDRLEAKAKAARKEDSHA